MDEENRDIMESVTDNEISEDETNIDINIDTDPDTDIDIDIDTDTEMSESDINIDINTDPEMSEGALDDGSEFETIDTTDLGDRSVRFTVSREAGYDNTIGFYEVAEDGSVLDPITGEAIAVGEAGYQVAALLGSLDFTISVDNGETAEFVTDALSEGTQYGTFIIADGGLDELLDADSSNNPAIYFATAEANVDNFDHIRSAGSNTLEYEDLFNGMSIEFDEPVADFNDIVLEYDFV